MPMIETRDGTWLYVKDWGKGNPVILIHGWPLSSDSWDPIAEALANAGHRVISYDRRGFGRSEQAWNGYDYDSLTDDLADVMKATDAAENVTLIGFSMGGGEVARYMSRYDGAGIVRAILVSSVVPYLLQAEDNPGGVPHAWRPRCLKTSASLNIRGLRMVYSKPTAIGSSQTCWRFLMVRNQGRRTRKTSSSIPHYRWVDTK